MLRRSLHLRPLSKQEGAIVDFLHNVGIRPAVDLTPAAALGTLAARGMVNVVDGEARLSDRGKIAAGQRARGTGWRSALASCDPAFPFRSPAGSGQAGGTSRASRGRTGGRAAASRRPARLVPPKAGYLLNGEPLEGGLAAFFRDNDFEEDELADMRRLQPGQTYRSGGGGWAEWELKRVS